MTISHGLHVLVLGVGVGLGPGHGGHCAVVVVSSISSVRVGRPAPLKTRSPILLPIKQRAGIFLLYQSLKFAAERNTARIA